MLFCLEDVYYFKEQSNIYIVEFIQALISEYLKWICETDNLLDENINSSAKAERELIEVPR